MRKLLLGSAVAVALLTGCGDEKKESTQATETTKEIKKDGEIFTETAQRIMHQIIKTHKSFLVDKYLKENEEAIKAGNDGKNYLADEYIKIRTEWLILLLLLKMRSVN
mgnify:CR=1 FL=1